MVLFFFVDLVSSACLNLVFSVSSWIVYKSVGGVYHVYKRYGITHSIKDHNVNELIEPPYIVLTTEEYDRLINKSESIDHINQKLDSLNRKISEKCIEN